MQALGRIALSTMIAYTAHYGSTKIYNEICVPDGIWGFFQGLIATGSPVCQAVYAVMTHSQVTYSSFIVLGLGSLAIEALPSYKKQETPPESTA